MKRSATLPLPAGRGLKLAVVADTHSLPHPDALAHIAARSPDAIVHAGDIGDRAVLDALGEVAPVHAIRGNIDPLGLPDVLVLDAAGVRIVVVHIAVAGPRLRADASRLARAEDAALVVCGHSHVPFIGRDAGVAVFNPGSIGPRRFHLPIVFGTIDIDRERRVRFAHVDCETGDAWMPPA